MTPLISIILPFFNARLFIAETIESVLASTFSRYEIICIDDGSSDDSLAIVQRYALSDSRIKIIKLCHVGIVEALNQGINTAKSEILARIDADDICMPDRLSLQYQHLIDNPSVMLSSCLVEPFADQPISCQTMHYFHWLNASLTNDNIYRDLYVESPLIHPSVMFRKSALQQTGLYREYDGPEDYDLWLRMAGAGMQFSKVPKTLLKYRIYPNSLSRTDMVHYHRNAILNRKLAWLAGNINNGLIAHNRKLRIIGFCDDSKIAFEYLLKNRIGIDAFVDFSDSGVGQECEGVAVLPAKNIGKDDQGILYLCVVEKWSMINELRAFFNQRKMVEVKDFLLI